MKKSLLSIFKNNSYTFFWDYRWFITIFVVAVICDAITTIHFMLKDGIEAEVHLIIKYISRFLGPVAGPVTGAVGKILGGIVVGIFLRRFAAYIFMTASIISFWAAWYNLWGYKIYKPILLDWIPW